MRLTLDTNVLWDAADPSRAGHAVAVRLLELRDAGVCTLYHATRVDVDVPVGEARKRIDALPQLAGHVFGTAFRPDSSTLGEGDMLVDDHWIERERRVRAIVFPNAPETSKRERSRKSDLDHLLGHLQSGNEVFVTRDGAVLAARERLAEEFGISVLDPAEAVREIEARVGQR